MCVDVSFPKISIKSNEIPGSTRGALNSIIEKKVWDVMDDFSKSSQQEEKKTLKAKSICYVPIGPGYKT